MGHQHHRITNTCACQYVMLMHLLPALCASVPQPVESNLASSLKAFLVCLDPKLVENC